ncbi:MAG: sigma 54-interacting transcriptional regulator [Candidatus Riflebacteria bacterium]|nr:sigma 54-interacting transcriptional regulator [Candidatus Riflebacteria bacterium]
MPHVTILKGRRLDREFSFEKDPAFVGREEGNDLVLDDASVSRVHAKFLKDPGGWSIVDLNSTNGVYINNAKVKEMAIKDGDVVVLGDYTLFVKSVEVHEPEVGGTRSAYETLDALFLLTRKFGGPVSLSDLLEAMTDCLLEIFRAERGFILLKDKKKGCLADPCIVRRVEGTETRIQISKTVASKVLETLSPILVTDVEADSQFRNVKSIESGSVRSIICAPLLKEGADALGVVYLDSRLKSRAFTDSDLSMLDRFLEHASLLILTATERDRLRRNNENLKALTKEISLAEYNTDKIVGTSPRMKQVLSQVVDLAKEDVTVLLTGESGTGKELIAKAVHYSSRRSDRQFVAVNCMALSPELIESELFGHEKGSFSGAVSKRIGKFEQADGGTIFLDEIGELSQDVQVKLLRVLETRSICPVGANDEIELDIRLITATNRDLMKLVREGKFREDLYYRINVFNLELPPLRERKGDIPHLVTHFLEFFNRKMGKQLAGVDAEALNRLAAYDWPGNIRELKNVIERAFVVEKSKIITPASLPFALTQDLRARDALDQRFESFEYPNDFTVARDLFEKHFIIHSLKRHQGNITATAKETGLPRRTLYRRLEKFGIDPKEILSEESIQALGSLDDAEE